MMQFLSTPSARRATPLRQFQYPKQQNFYPRPPRGGRLAKLAGEVIDHAISIHALREEGDADCNVDVVRIAGFLSTPSARRATIKEGVRVVFTRISIHALREEGDPTPSTDATLSALFLSTPSARRATVDAV